jgi:hypothetical protein
MAKNQSNRIITSKSPYRIKEQTEFGSVKEIDSESTTTEEDPSSPESSLEDTDFDFSSSGLSSDPDDYNIKSNTSPDFSMPRSRGLPKGYESGARDTSPLPRRYIIRRDPSVEQSPPSGRDRGSMTRVSTENDILRHAQYLGHLSKRAFNLPPAIISRSTESVTVYDPELKRRVKKSKGTKVSTPTPGYISKFADDKEPNTEGATDIKGAPISQSLAYSQATPEYKEASREADLRGEQGPNIIYKDRALPGSSGARSAPRDMLVRPQATTETVTLLRRAQQAMDRKLIAGEAGFSRRSFTTDEDVQKLQQRVGRAVDAGGYVVQGLQYEDPYTSDKLVDTSDILNTDEKFTKDIGEGRKGRKRVNVLRVGSNISRASGEKMRGPGIPTDLSDEQVRHLEIADALHSKSDAMVREHPFGRPPDVPKMVDKGSGSPAVIKLREGMTETGSAPGNIIPSGMTRTASGEVVPARGRTGTSSQLFIARTQAAEEARRNRPPGIPPRIDKSVPTYGRMRTETRIRQELAAEREAAMQAQAPKPQFDISSREMQPGETAPQHARRVAEMDLASREGMEWPTPVRTQSGESIPGYRRPTGGSTTYTSDGRRVVAGAAALSARSVYGKNHPIWQRIGQQEAARRGV